jgi:hypothetical protein
MTWIGVEWRDEIKGRADRPNHGPGQGTPLHVLFTRHWFVEATTPARRRWLRPTGKRCWGQNFDLKTAESCSFISETTMEKLWGTFSSRGGQTLFVRLTLGLFCINKWDFCGHFEIYLLKFWAVLAKFKCLNQLCSNNTFKHCLMARNFSTQLN